MARKGGTSKINYRETRGLKVSDGQPVRIGAVLTRQGGKWKPGINVGGKGTLYALAEGVIYFSHRKSRYKTRQAETVVNIKKSIPKKT